MTMQYWHGLRWLFSAHDHITYTIWELALNNPSCGFCISVSCIYLHHGGIICFLCLFIFELFRVTFGALPLVALTFSFYSRWNSEYQVTDNIVRPSYHFVNFVISDSVVGLFFPFHVMQWSFFFMFTLSFVWHTCNEKAGLYVISILFFSVT